jgi:sugar lactone lactonase YvrE
MKTRYLPALLCLLLVGNAPGKTIPNNAIADLVLGQSNFTSNAFPATPSSFSLRTPSAVVVDPVSRKVFVTDRGNSRILRYPNVSSLSNGAGAEAVFGQPRFSSSVNGSGDQGLSNCNGLFFDRLGRLWLADTDNHRVLMYEAAVYRETQAYPDRVYGQPDFTTNSAGTTASKMNIPGGVWVDTEDRLWVGDFSNNRVLRFDSISTKASGAAADGVLGQVNFTTSVAGSGSSGLQGAYGVAVSSSGALFVVCNNANRVLRFNNAAALGNGAGASAVLGQPDFVTTSSGLSATQLSAPFGVSITPADTLWVTDYGNSRYLRFEGASTKASGAAANGVVGQPDFVTGANTTTNRGLSFPFFQTFVDATGSLWSADYSNNRVLRFPPDVTRPKLVVTTTVPKSTSSKSLTVKGTASDAYGVSKVSYKVNAGSTKTATGTTSWQFKAALAVGKNTITINSVDSVGNKSTSKVIKIVRE